MPNTPNGIFVTQWVLNKLPCSQCPLNNVWLWFLYLISVVLVASHQNSALTLYCPVCASLFHLLLSSAVSLYLLYTILNRLNIRSSTVNKVFVSQPTDTNVSCSETLSFWLSSFWLSSRRMSFFDEFYLNEAMTLRKITIDIIDWSLECQLC